MSAEEKPALIAPSEPPTLWINEVSSIELGEHIAIVTFAETVHSEGDLTERRVRARFAMSRDVLSNFAMRVERLARQAKALEGAAGRA